MKHYRQGDVLVIEDNGSEVGKEIKRDNGRVILAYGEVTGHAHAFSGQNVYLYEHAKNAGEKILKVEKTSDLCHEEHSKITIPAGKYRVIIQREYSPEDIRNVRD